MAEYLDRMKELHKEYGEEYEFIDIKQIRKQPALTLDRRLEIDDNGKILPIYADIVDRYNNSLGYKVGTAFNLDGEKAESYVAIYKKK
ncbi:MAG: hypothetical protein AABW50_05945 [Nanoarchaeota archaeon]